jgi:tRNA (guanine37-N1)-methyltransferase
VELSKCYVVTGHHGSGVASALLAATIDAARSRGAAGIWLGVNQHNPRANAFYDKSGFRIVGTKHFLVGEQLHEDFVRELLL